MHCYHYTIDYSSSIAYNFKYVDLIIKIMPKDSSGKFLFLRAQGNNNNLNGFSSKSDTPSGVYAGVTTTFFIGTQYLNSSWTSGFGGVKMSGNNIIEPPAFIALKNKTIELVTSDQLSNQAILVTGWGFLDV